MKTIPLGEAKTYFSSVIKAVAAGSEIAISYGKKKEVVAVIMPYDTWKKTNKRRLGTLQGKGKISFAPDFAMTEEELAGL